MGQTTNTLYVSDNPVLETDNSGKETGRTTHGAGIALSRKAGSETLGYLYNGHADVVALINSGGTAQAPYTYDAFGVPLSSTGTAKNPIRYGGYEFDEETGYYYLKSRFYDPKTARFLQEDTYRGTTMDPLSLNLYAYCHNNPVVYWDPTGHREVVDGNKPGRMVVDTKPSRNAVISHNTKSTPAPSAPRLVGNSSQVKVETKTTTSSTTGITRTVTTYDTGERKTASPQSTTVSRSGTSGREARDSSDRGSSSLNPTTSSSKSSSSVQSSVQHTAVSSGGGKMNQGLDNVDLFNTSLGIDLLTGTRSTWDAYTTEARYNNLPGNLKNAAYQNNRYSHPDAERFIRLQKTTKASSYCKINGLFTKSNVFTTVLGAAPSVYEKHEDSISEGLTGADYDAAMASSVIVESGGAVLSAGAGVGAAVLVGASAPVSVTVGVSILAGFVVSAGYEESMEYFHTGDQIQDAIRKNSSLEDPYTMQRDK